MSFFPISVRIIMYNAKHCDRYGTVSSKLSSTETTFKDMQQRPFSKPCKLLRAMKIWLRLEVISWESLAT